jgi:uncharacterized membrane protein YadS
MATEPVVRGRAEQVCVAVSTVVVFGTLDIFLYPAMYHLNVHYHLLTTSPTAYGIYAGSTIHEVAQVVAAGRAIADSAANTAVITKMVRVMMLAPFLIALSAYLSRTSSGDDRGPASSGDARDKASDCPALGGAASNGEAPSGEASGGATAAAGAGSLGVSRSPGRIVVPWFALGFVAVTGLNSLAILPRAAVSAAVSLDTVLLAMAMTALGLTTHISAVRTAGVKPLALAALLFIWLIFGGGAINAGISALFG